MFVSLSWSQPNSTLYWNFTVAQRDIFPITTPYSRSIKTKAHKYMQMFLSPKNSFVLLLKVMEGEKNTVNW